MQLAAIWVNGHYLFNTASFNLGGKYLYKFELKENALIVSREENYSYIPNFFSDSSPNLSLVSAIVGQNGAGKTTVLTLIRNAIHGNHAWGGYVLYKHALLIFENKVDNEIHAVYSVPIYERGQRNSLEIQAVGFSGKQERIKVETVYFSPFIEGKEFYLNISAVPDIDVSGDMMLRLDIERNSSKDDSDPVLEHSRQNIERQFDFMQSPLAKKLKDDYRFPFYDAVKLKFRGPKFYPDSNFFNNTPDDFRPFIKKIYETWRDEIHSTSTQVRRDTDINEDKKLIKLWFLRTFLSSLCRPLEDSNTYLDEGKVRIKPEDLDNLTGENALFKFLDSHYFIKFKGVSLPTDAIKRLISDSFGIIDGLPKKNLRDTNAIHLDFDSARKMLDVHKDFLNGMKKFSDDPVGFIDIEPDIELSSGEKAVLDLFSRFNYSIREIQRRKNEDDIKGYGANFPKHFILLLDEGDMGFHPVWKKKYVKTIVDVLPKFFEQYEGVTVQIIFTTHDPLTLSDMPNCNVIYMKREGDSCMALEIGNSNRPKQSFGANISTLLSDSFFVEDGLVGDFAVQKIDKTIQWLQDKNDSSDVGYHQRVIENIDEPLIRKKLSEMFAEKTGQSLLELKVIEEQIRMLEERKKELQNKA